MGTTTLLSFEEFEELPSEPGKMELLDGELIRLPPAKIRHTKIIHGLSDLLRSIVGKTGAGLGVVYIEAGYKIGRNNWLQPDVSITRRGQPETDYLEGAPALAIEVISESNTADQMQRKVKLYLANGAQEVWVVYPKTRSVWVFQEGRAAEFRGVLRSGIGGGMEIDLERIFP
jgi:Uma2 family endonuclease